MTEHIPLNKLILSPRNVRKTNGEEDIESLADSIHSKGLLQNLVVSRAAGSSGKSQKYAVDAGGRRFRALQRNRKLDRIPANHPVPCHIIASEDGLEASLAENLQKIAMNPADEVEAFAAIIGNTGAGTDSRGDINDTATRIANCARRFGRTENYVKQRLALAALAPDILDALRIGKITIESARAYAGHSDHKVQMKVFAAEEKKTDTYQTPHLAKTVRDALAGKIYTADHKVVKYVGIDAYVDAGGRLETDLFFGEGEREILLDPSIVDRLANDKAAREAMELAQKQGWAGGVAAPANAPFYIDPKPPQGYVSKWGAADEIAESDRSVRVIGFRVADDRSGLEPVARTHFVPEEPAEQGDEQEPHSGATAWAAQQRQDRIDLYAARMAAPSISGSPLENRAFWPVDDRDELQFFDEDDGSTCAIVTLLIKVPIDDLQPHLEAAEQKYEALQAERQRIAERIEDLESQGLHEAAQRLRTTGSETEPDPGDPDGGEQPEPDQEEAPAEDEQVAA